jgi:VanZ family protein
LRLLIDARARTALFSLWCLGWAIVLFESLRPAPEMPFDLSDKFWHFAGYAVMAAGAASFAHQPRDLLRWALFAILMGGLVELAQGLTPMRSMDALDFLANTTGVALGTTAALLWLTLVIGPLRRRLAEA